MRRTLCLLGFITILLYTMSSCCDKVDVNENMSVIHYTDFPEVVELTGEEYVVNDAMMQYPFRLRVIDDYLYVMDLHTDENFMHILNKNTMELVASFAPRGNGPNEIVQAKNFYSLSHDSIWLYDMAKRKITRWEFSCSDNSVKCVENIELDESIMAPFDFTLYTDTSFIFTDDSGVNRYIEVNMKGKTIKAFGKIPLSEKARTEEPVLIAQGWASYLLYSPIHRKLISATQLGDVLEIYDINDTSSVVSYGKTADPKFAPQQEGYSIPIGLMGHGDIQITDKFIYTIFYGRAFRELFRTNGETSDGGKYLNVYDLNGNPLKQYILDHEITGIFVDDKENVLWATDVNTEEQIIKYVIAN